MDFNIISRRTMGLFLALALMLSLLDISKAFYVPHCLAFDVNDDANHTFINLQQWRRILGQGQWPMMNVYNNFGTPLIGDVITYPLSPLALTYFFLPGPMAMTINRLLIGFLSMFLLFIFFHRRFPKFLSIGLGLCTFYAPGFLWHSNHHHFQLTLILLTSILLLQEQLTRKLTVANYVGLCLLCMVMFMGVSINVVLVLCLLIFGYQVFLSDNMEDKRLWIVLSGLLCGVIAVFPDTLLFLLASLRSMRGLAEYPVANMDGANKIFLTPIVAAGIYSFVLFKENRPKEASLGLWLGIVPSAIVLLSRFAPELWKQIPFLGATDVVRLTWGASIFLMIASGGLLMRWLQMASGWRTQVLIGLLVLGFDAYTIPFVQAWLYPGKIILASVWGLVIIYYVCWFAGKIKIQDSSMARGMVSFMGGAVVVFYMYYGFLAVLGFGFPNICHVSGRGAFSEVGSEKFLLPKMLSVVPKNSRVAYDFNTILGLDLRGAREGIFGSGARSTIMTNEDFSVGLFADKLIQFDNYTGDYHFSPPWRSKDLQKLGIGYVVEQKDDKGLIAQGWKQTEVDKGVFLYRNPEPSGVVFLKDGEKISPVPFAVDGNGLDIQLPGQLQKSEQLVISLLRIPGWQAWIDGRNTGFLDSENKFLTLVVSPQDQLVKVRYEPVPAGLILFCFLAALVFPWVMITLTKKNGYFI